jgi:hypothetical protein
MRSKKVTYNYTAKDRDCLKRAMYFESEHSDRSGYMAVGTVVMNRLTSGAYPDTICGVVAQKQQFAPGVMTRTVVAQAQSDLDSAADAILHGQRHPGVKDAMFFHTDGLKFPYNNMHYVVVAGGNAFYEKRSQDGLLETPAPLPAYEVAMNFVSANPLGYAQQAQTVTQQNQPFAQQNQSVAQQTQPLAQQNQQFAQHSQPFAQQTQPVTQQTQTFTPVNASAPTQVNVILPAQVPVPTPMPSTTTLYQTNPGPIAVPTPRPGFDSASLRGPMVAYGG